MARRRPLSRLAAHIDTMGRAFLPASRMAHIRWEESVARAQAKREGIVDPVVTHLDCHCGSIECLGVPVARGPKRRRSRRSWRSRRAQAAARRKR
jgi:hypothetical protein